MKTFCSILLFTTLCSPIALHAQRIKVISSTQQSWSGGIAGMSGNNYTFTIEFSNYKTLPLPDTLWIGQEAIELMPYDQANGQNGNTKIAHTKGTETVEITASTSNNEYADRYSPPITEDKKRHLPHPPVAYKGIAMLSYKYNNKEHYFTICRVLKELPTANYP